MTGRLPNLNSIHLVESSVDSIAAQPTQNGSIWTIGHSTRSIEAFIELLDLNSIGLLIDVRRFAGSKKYPQFNRDSLSASLEWVGIEYEHWPVLGGRRRPKADSPNQVWENDSFRGYADYMETPDFQAAMQKLMARARRSRTAIMCSEAVWWRCHRSMISDYLMNQGIPIFHILDKSAPTLHPFTKPYLAAHGSGPTDREFLYHP